MGRHFSLFATDCVIWYIFPNVFGNGFYRHRQRRRGASGVDRLAEKGAKVTVLTKDKASESNTEYAQGGVAVVLAEDDNPELHEDDTLIAGAGLCDIEAVETLVTEGTRYIKQLIDWGAEFDSDGGKLIFTQEAAHSRRRIIHANGDSTGAELVRSLIAKAGTATFDKHRPIR